jgi:hypothetical protein
MFENNQRKRVSISGQTWFWKRVESRRSMRNVS